MANTEHLPDNLYEVTLNAVIESLFSQRFPNAVARFCLLSVLLRVQQEWEDHKASLPKERANEIERRLLPIVRRFLSRTLYATYADSEEDTNMLVEVYSYLYGPNFDA